MLQQYNKGFKSFLCKQIAKQTNKKKNPTPHQKNKPKDIAENSEKRDYD